MPQIGTPRTDTRRAMAVVRLAHWMEKGGKRRAPQDNRMLNVILVAAALFLVSTGGTGIPAGGGGPTMSGGTSTARGGAAATFPPLMGMNIGAKNYESAAYQAAMAKLDGGIPR